MTKVLNFGSINIDLIFRVPHIVLPGETLSSRSLSVAAGGKGANQSAALAKAGAQVFHAGLIGDDGGWVKTLLSGYGVDTSLIRSWEGKTGQALIQVADNGENSIVLHGGGNQNIDTAFVEEVLAHFDRGDLLLLQNEISNIGTIMERAAAKGMKILFNPAPCNEEVKSYPLELVNTFFLNETEAFALAGFSPDAGKHSGAGSKASPEASSKTSPEALLENLLEKYSQSEIILTLGEKGALYGSSANRISAAAYPVKAVDTTAAGDTFIGYYLAAILEGSSIKDALDLACRAAAYTVTGMGAMETIPDSDTLSEFLS